MQSSTLLVSETKILKHNGGKSVQCNVVKERQATKAIVYSRDWLTVGKASKEVLKKATTKLY